MLQIDFYFEYNKYIWESFDVKDWEWRNIYYIDNLIIDIIWKRKCYGVR